MKDNFFNDAQKKFKGELIRALVVTAGSAILDFSANNPEQDVCDLISTVLTVFSREILGMLFAGAGVEDEEMKLKIINNLFSAIKDEVINNHEKEKSLH